MQKGIEETGKNPVGILCLLMLLFSSGVMLVSLVAVAQAESADPIKIKKKQDQAKQKHPTLNTMALFSLTVSMI